MSSKNSPYRLVASLSALALTANLVSCGGNNDSTTTSSNNTTPTTSGGETAAKLEIPLKSNVSLTGAGASFPAPLYLNWFTQLNQEIPQVQVNYQSVGSGAGVEQFTKGTVDFGASDVAMKDEEIAKVSKGVLLLPMTAGAIVAAYNLPGVEGGLKLSQEVLVGIFKGDITKWNDPKIAKDNPDLKLPDKPITVVHRSDGSGSTAVFTTYLSAVNPEWEKSIGKGKSVEWPSSKGKFIGAKGNEGITASIQQNEGSIGYVEYGYAKNNNIPMAALQNKAGKFVEPTDETEQAALSSGKLPADLRAFITNPEGDNSYPIVTYTWILAYKKYDDPNKAIAMEATIQYGLTKGQAQSAALGYIPLPKEVIEKVAAAADQISPDYQIKIN